VLEADTTLFNALENAQVGEALRFWEARTPTVIVGRFGKMDSEVHEHACIADDIPILRRTTGGGAVVVAPGCLNYSLVLSLDTRPELRDVMRSYQLVLTTLIQVIGVSGLTIEGLSDIAWNGRKVSGNAQRRGRRALLHHGTLLYDFDASMMDRYLKIPPRAPAYRAGRTHQAFVTNLPLDASALHARIAAAFPL
jgi:lipoate-protein ligase A